MRESSECPGSRILLLSFEVLINTLKYLDGVPIVYTHILELGFAFQGDGPKLEALVGHAAHLLELLDGAGGGHGAECRGHRGGYYCGCLAGDPVGCGQGAGRQ